MVCFFKQALRKAIAARQVLATTGNESDLLYLVDPVHYQYRNRYNSAAHSNVLQSIIKAKRARPSGLQTKVLLDLLDEKSTTLKVASIQIASLWRVQELHDAIAELTTDIESNLAIRLAAIRGLPRIQPSPDTSPLIKIAESKPPIRVYTAAMTALVELNPQTAAKLSLATWLSDEEFKLTSNLVEAFLKRSGGSQAMTSAIDSSELKVTQAKHLLDQVISLGYSAPDLTQVLRNIAGYSSEIPSYSDAYVQALVQEIESQGDPNAGKRVFHSAAANCLSCHQLNGKGQKLGPDLSNAGSGIPLRRLIEEVIWPTRHVKEGYALTQLTTKEGKIILGYERRERDQEQHVILDEFGSAERIRVSRQEVVSRQEIGTIMPATAVSQLTRPELRDLISFLSQLRSADISK